jgi:EamA domain-containing membrane protein RarD
MTARKCTSFAYTLLCLSVRNRMHVQLRSSQKARVMHLPNMRITYVHCTHALLAHSAEQEQSTMCMMVLLCGTVAALPLVCDCQELQQGC